MKNEKCKCGGKIGTWVTFTKNDKSLYENLGSCMDCNKNYLLTANGYKGISDAELRRIAKSRVDKLSIADKLSI